MDIKAMVLEKAKNAKKALVKLGFPEDSIQIA